MDVNTDLAMVARQERALTCDRFDEEVAWTLGSLLRDRGRAGDRPIVVDVRIFHRESFFAALPGSTPDDVHRARRKRDVVERFHRGSDAVGPETAQRGTTVETRFGR